MYYFTTKMYFYLYRTIKPIRYVGSSR